MDYAIPLSICTLIAVFILHPFFQTNIMPNSNEQTDQIDIRSDLWTSIQSLLADQLGMDEEQIHPHSKLTEDLGCDSLDHIEIIMAIEEEHALEIPDDEAAKVKTAADIHTYLTAHKQQKDLDL